MADIARRINSPTLASIAVFGDQGQWIRGRTTHPTRIWRGIEVDEHLKDEWLEAINSIPEMEVRASCEGHWEGGELRPTYLVFRLLPEEDSKAELVAGILNSEVGIYSLTDIGWGERPRIVVAAKLAYGDPGWEEFWSGMANRIRVALDIGAASEGGNPGGTRIAVRFGEWLDPQEFIRPRQVEDLAAELMIGLAEEEAVHAAWDYVCKQIEYPPDDRHFLGAFSRADLPFFGLKYLIERSTVDFWQYPSETLAWGYGDCEDSSICLCSLLRAGGIAPERVWVVVGTVNGYGHAWVELDGRILETTLASAPNPVSRDYVEYTPRWRFNDLMLEGEIVFVPKDEGSKLKWLGTLWQHPTKPQL